MSDMADDKKNTEKKIAYLSREQIFAASRKSLQPQSVDVPEWGGPVRYKPMTMTERRSIRKNCQTFEIDQGTGERTTTLDPEKFEIMALIHCCLDPEDDAKLLFTKDHAEDLETKMAAGPISTVSTAILRSSGLAPDAIKRGQSGTEDES